MLVLMRDKYNKEVILTKMFSEYDGARFEDGRFVNIEESAASLKKAIEKAIRITQNLTCHEQIRNSVLREFDYTEQAKRAANACFAIANSSHTKRRFLAASEKASRNKENCPS